MAERHYLDLTARVVALGAAARRTRRASVLAAVFGVMGGLLLGGVRAPVAAQATPQFLTVRGITVVDEKGVARVRLGAPLPDPTVIGKQMPRQGVVSGLMIYDSDGDERGGYVTEAHGDAFLSLDAKRFQQAVFVANRDGGANLSVWSGANRNDNYVSVQAVPNPTIEIVQNGKRRILTVAGER